MSSLRFLAGSKAIQKLRQDGLQADAIKVVAGAAGGPKWLALSQLDRFLFGEFFRGRREPLFLIGSSIGTWRFAAVSQKDPLTAISAFEKAYIEQTYGPRPSAGDVTKRSYEVLDAFLSPAGPDDLFQHPTHRLSILTARARRPVASDRQKLLTLGLAGAVISNAVSPRGTQLFFERTLFFDPRSEPPYLRAADFASRPVPLSKNNIRQALMASGSIPLVMAGISNIPGAPAGIYRDGGLIDYHLNVPFLPADDEQLVLYPHFESRLVPGWFDKHLPWRKPGADRMAQALVVMPSPQFIASLPFQKIPDRTDFTRFQGRDQERFAYWRRVTQECRRLADEFHEVISRGQLPERLEPLDDFVRPIKGAFPASPS